MQTDVLIIGGGPAGLATAIAARGKGLRVALLDHRTPPIDKACGEGLLPEAVAALRVLGIEPNSSRSQPFAGLRFSDQYSSVDAAFGAGQAFGMRRTVLHNLLVERATETGVTMFWQTAPAHLESGAVRAGTEPISYRWLIGADGQNSRVRKFASLESRMRPHHRYGFRRHYAAAPWSPFVDVHWGTDCQVVVTPTGSREVCVSMLSGAPRLRLDAALASFFPALGERLRKARIVSTEAGAVTFLGRARSVRRGNIALVGDASGMVDGIAGQGLSLAFQQALHLADALAADDLAAYEKSHARVVRIPRRMTRLLLMMTASDTLRRRAMKLFARKPALFAGLVAAHTSPLLRDALKPARIVNLGWGLLWHR